MDTCQANKAHGTTSGTEIFRGISGVPSNQQIKAEELKSGSCARPQRRVGMFHPIHVEPKRVPAWPPHEPPKAGRNGRQGNATAVIPLCFTAR